MANTFHLVGLTEEERSRHIYISDKPDRVNQQFFFHSAKDDIQKGRGVCVIDPHGDLAEDLLNIVPEESYYLTLYTLIPFDIDYPVRINLLELTPGLRG